MPAEVTSWALFIAHVFEQGTTVGQWFRKYRCPWFIYQCIRWCRTIEHIAHYISTGACTLTQQVLLFHTFPGWMPPPNNTSTTWLTKPAARSSKTIGRRAEYRSCYRPAAAIDRFLINFLLFINRTGIVTNRKARKISTGSRSVFSSIIFFSSYFIFGRISQVKPEVGGKDEIIYIKSHLLVSRNIGKYHRSCNMALMISSFTRLLSLTDRRYTTRLSSTLDGMLEK